MLVKGYKQWDWVGGEERSSLFLKMENTNCATGGPFMGWEGPVRPRRVIRKKSGSSSSRGRWGHAARSGRVLWRRETSEERQIFKFTSHRWGVKGAGAGGGRMELTHSREGGGLTSRYTITATKKRNPDEGSGGSISCKKEGGWTVSSEAREGFSALSRPSKKKCVTRHEQAESQKYGGPSTSGTPEPWGPWSTLLLVEKNKKQPELD